MTLTWDGAVLSPYRNGKLAASKPRDFVYANTQSHILCGFLTSCQVYPLGGMMRSVEDSIPKLHSSLQQPWKGTIDDPRYYSHALTRELIKNPLNGDEDPDLAEADIRRFRATAAKSCSYRQDILGG